MNENSYIYGRNAVYELMNSDMAPSEILVASGNRKGSIQKIIDLANEKNIKIKEIEQRKLEEIINTDNHQGVAAILSEMKYVHVDDILSLANEKGEDPFIIIANQIEDPHNLGALIRTADAVGAHGLVIAKHRSASVTPTVFKTSAGASAHLKIAMVTNIADTIDYLKKKGVWTFGADMDGEPIWTSNMSGPVALVIGSEGKGISKLVKEKCDVIVSIPMNGKINSLNASVAGGVLMYEVARTRFLKK